MDGSHKTYTEIIATPFFFSVELAFEKAGLFSVNFVKKKEKRLSGHAWGFVTDMFVSYFQGGRPGFRVPLVLPELPAFTLKVLGQCSRIPYGEVSTYAEIARLAGSAKASRAAGNALRRNPLPVIIPCHRVIGSDGGLHGYMGREGVAIKQCLLDFEKKHLS